MQYLDGEEIYLRYISYDTLIYVSYLENDLEKHMYLGINQKKLI